MDLKLKERVAIVTGAGRGIGRSIARLLAEEGAFVVVNDIDLKVAEETSKGILSMGKRSSALQADITRPDDVKRMVDQAVEEFGGIDILINNAGIVYDEHKPSTRNSFADSKFEDWQREIDLILYGTMNCIRAVIGHMIERKSGKIVNIASDAGRAGLGVKRVSTYSAAKGGVIALTRALAVEFAEYGITINAVSPGLTRTTRIALTEELKDTRPKEYEYYKYMEKSQVDGIALGRMGEPDDIAQLVVFLASSAANWITGQTYSVNGGQIMI
jgi:NAD(P)-dependent dehydrogenase (short-subunit alcohol dehydrogenase family)